MTTTSDTTARARRWAAGALAVAALTAACGGGGGGGETSAGEDAGDRSAPAAAALAAEATGPAGGGGDSTTSAKSVDVCGRLAPADAGKALGATITRGEPIGTQGGMLGQCTYTGDGEGVSAATISARGAHEFQGVLGITDQQEAVSGVGKQAAWTEAGLIVLLDDHMVQVIVVTETGGFDKAKSVALGTAYASAG